MRGSKKKIGMGEGVAFPRTGFGNLLHKFNTFDFPRKGGGAQDPRCKVSS